MNRLFRILFVLLLLSGLSACQNVLRQAQFPVQFDYANQQKVADDVAQQLALLYPPAQSILRLQQLPHDSFGACLTERLRTRGYAVLELSDEKQSESLPAPAVFGSVDPAHATPAEKSILLSYTLDQIRNADLLRISLLINQQQSLSRAYQNAPTGMMIPVSPWIYRE